MQKFCCIGLTLAARVIGAFGLSASILMINVLMSDFFSRNKDEDFLETIETWALLGLNWTQFLKTVRSSKQAVQMTFICFLCYSFLLLIASAFLALGTVCRRPKYAMPWLYLQMVSIIDQTISLCVHLLHEPYNCDVYKRSSWYIPLASLYLLTSVYFWTIVYSARQEWYKYVGPYDNFDLTSDPDRPSVRVTSEDFNLPKTPSYIAQNRSIFESPPPHIPIKYNIV